MFLAFLVPLAALWWLRSVLSMFLAAAHQSGDCPLSIARRGWAAAPLQDAESVFKQCLSARRRAPKVFALPVVVSGLVCTSRFRASRLGAQKIVELLRDPGGASLCSPSNCLNGMILLLLTKRPVRRSSPACARITGVSIGLRVVVQRETLRCEFSISRCFLKKAGLLCVRPGRDGNTTVARSAYRRAF